MGGMSKPLSHARLVVIDLLQFVDHLITPSTRSSKFGCDSLRMIGIEPWAPIPKPLRARDWKPPVRDHCALHCVGVTGNVALIGGIIQNSKNEFVGALAGSIGMEGQLVANLLATR